MYKPFVEVNGNFFKVIQDKSGGYHLQPVKAEEALTEEMEKIVLSDVEEIQISMFQEIIDNARKDLKSTLEKNLKQTVLHSLGFEKDRWGQDGYRVDHCNGRMSEVTNLISKEVRERLLNVEIQKDFSLTAEEKKQMKDEMEREFKESYKREMRKLMWKEGEALAKDHVNQIIGELTKNKLQAVASAMLEKTLKKS